MIPFRFGALVLLLTAATAAQPPAEPVVRVRILDQEAPTEVRVEATAGPLRVLLDGVESGALQPGEIVTLTRLGRDVRARFGGADVSARALTLNGDGFRLRAGRVDRRYAGNLACRLADGQIELVNHTPIEPYVASVVQSEFGFAVLEGAKAQAVLARTYALRRAGEHATYDLDDDQRSQVFRGVDAASATSRRAATETRGEVLTFGGDLAEATYFSSSGGHTADNDVVWNSDPVPYLRGVPDPYDDASPDHTWRTSASRSAVLRALSRQAGGTVSGFEIERRSRSGRVQTVRLFGGRTPTISGGAFRRAVNAAVGARTVRSTKFDVTANGDTYVFRGGGYGHGVGMSQYGALGQARAGRSYRDILAYYFVGTYVRGTEAPALVAAGDRPDVGTPAATVPRRPASALRTRYRPAAARSWPTPRHVARQQEAEAARAEPPPPAPVPAPQPQETQARRTAW